MWRNIAGPLPRVDAEYNSQEWREQMRAQAVWWIRERHEKCAGCSKFRDPEDWNGRCTFCGTYVCSMACFYDHIWRLMPGHARVGGDGLQISYKAFPESVSMNQISGGALMGFVSNIFMMQTG